MTMKIELIGTGAIGAMQMSACTLINNQILVDMPNRNYEKVNANGTQHIRYKDVFDNSFAWRPFF